METLGFIYQKCQTNKLALLCIATNHSGGIQFPEKFKQCKLSSHWLLWTIELVFSPSWS